MMKDAPIRFIRRAEVMQMTGLTAGGLVSRVRRGEFPQPALLDARQPAWVESEVQTWMAARIADRDAGRVSAAREAVLESRRRGGRTRGRDMAAEVAAARDQDDERA